MIDLGLPDEAEPLGDEWMILDQHFGNGFAALEFGPQEASFMLIELLSEPWMDTMTRLLLKNEHATLEDIFKRYGAHPPAKETIQRGHWPVVEVKQILEPMLEKRISKLLHHRAFLDYRSDAGDRTPLMHAATQGLHEVVKQLLAAKANVHLSDACRRQALHYAVSFQQDESLIETLLKARADPTARDLTGNTAERLGQLLGLSLRGSVREPTEDGEQLSVAPIVPPRTSLHARSRSRSRSRSSGRSLRATNLAKAPAAAQATAVPATTASSYSSSSSFSPARPIPTQNGLAPSWAASLLQPMTWRVLDVEMPASPAFRGMFLRDFLVASRPVILRRPRDKSRTDLWPTTVGTGEGSPWSRESLCRRAGAMNIEVSRIPYAKDFGCTGDVVRTTLADFLEGRSAKGADQTYTPYFFTALGEGHPQLNSLVSEALAPLPVEFPMPFDQLQPKALQFSVGGVFSGAPPHFHDDALNVLLAGRKRWRLWRPCQAAMSRLLWRELEDHDLEGSFELEQNEGDILYIPFGWGHTVLNVVENTVCVAIEFAG